MTSPIPDEKLQAWLDWIERSSTPEPWLSAASAAYPAVIRELQAARKALAFYANEQNYRWDWVPMTPYVNGNPDPTKPKEDRGLIARAALPPEAAKP